MHQIWYQWIEQILGELTVTLSSELCEIEVPLFLFFPR